eukprot:4840213-Prymnesium_polylepis.1
MKWVSDYSGTRSGWKICFFTPPSAPASPAMPPVPPIRPPAPPSPPVPPSPPSSPPIAPNRGCEYVTVAQIGSGVIYNSEMEGTYAFIGTFAARPCYRQEAPSANEWFLLFSDSDRLWYVTKSTLSDEHYENAYMRHLESAMSPVDLGNWQEWVENPGDWIQSAAIVACA